MNIMQSVPKQPEIKDGPGKLYVYTSWRKGKEPTFSSLERRAPGAAVGVAGKQMGPGLS